MDETLASVIAAAAAAASAASAAASAASAAAVSASSAALFLAAARSATNSSPTQPRNFGVSGHSFQGTRAQSSDEDHQDDREREVEHQPTEDDLKTTVNSFTNLNVDENDSIKQEKSEVVDEDIKKKIIQQVERYFCDQNLRSNKNWARMVAENKGFVPIENIASFNKMKTLTRDYALIVSALRESSLLVVSTDGKKVKRRHSFQLPEVGTKVLTTTSFKVASSDRQKVKRNHPFQLPEFKDASYDGQKMKQLYPFPLSEVKDAKDNDSLSNEKNGHNSRTRRRRLRRLQRSSKHERQRMSTQGNGTTDSTHRIGILVKNPICPRLPDGTRGFAIGRGRPPVSQ